MEEVEVQQSRGQSSQKMRAINTVRKSFDRCLSWLKDGSRPFKSTCLLANTIGAVVCLRVRTHRFDKQAIVKAHTNQYSSQLATVLIVCQETITMRLALLLLAPAAVLAFVPAVQKTTSSTKLDMERRDVLITGIMGLVAAPGMAQAVSASSTFFYDDKIEQVKEASQMPTGGKLDLNSAFVVSCAVA